MNQFANEAETMKHFEEMYARYGRRELMIWETSDGKWIDTTVLDSLVAQGKITRVLPAQVSPYLSGHWIYNPSK